MRASLPGCFTPETPMSARTTLLASALLVAFAGCATTPSTRTGADAAGSAAGQRDTSKAAQLERLYAQYWEELLKLNPVQATFQGDNRYNDQLPDAGSAEFRERSRKFTQDWLRRVEAVGSDGLQGQALLSYEIFVRDAKSSLESDQYPGWMQPIQQMGGLPSFAVQLGSGTGAQPFKTVQDYDNWLKRGSRVPVLFDTAIANMREGMAKGVVRPRPLMEKVVPQLDAIIKPRPEDTLFWGPVKNMPADFSDADKARLTAAYREMIGEQLMPAYRELRAFIVDEYLPKTRSSVGQDKLPNGAAWYAFNVRQSTSTDLTPAQIHDIGLKEVARIHGEIRKVMQQVGFKGDLQDFFRFMRTDKRFEYRTEGELLEHYRSLEDKINARVGEQFSLIPKSPFEIRPVEPYRAKSAAGGSYMSPSEDGKRPGIFYVNTYDLPSRKRWDAEDLYLHEAIPGHHFQLALQQELTDLPKFRRFGGETAFIEGWGLYAESLGKDLGVYTDPYDYFGYLQNELWRAIRLVTDTGLHSKGWSRDQVIKYMLENSAESETQATAEAERYIAWPGQALAYKIGELKIKELRTRAEQALGANFDVREFHAEVLKDGSVPLDVLEAKIDRWIATKRG
jgi:uncharacterized protein (DUF885 family)